MIPVPAFPALTFPALTSSAPALSALAFSVPAFPVPAFPALTLIKASIPAGTKALINILSLKNANHTMSFM